MTDRSRAEAVEVLRAGGLVPIRAALGKDDAVDVVVARAYRHGALPGRTIVRLSAESVAAGDELEMATLGFAPGEDRGAVAKERTRPLGFPGWALVHDPSNARLALDVVKEFKQQARTAKTRPGHARDGIEELAARLGKSVPQFLPSLYEEAGRAFIAHGAPSYAAAMFGKAREAEAVHALPVDEQHRLDAFLEFALAGAVTTKALAQYAKDLSAHHAPPLAYAHFRRLSVQRTLGGMPPWSGMAKELRRLAKAAGLDPDAEDAAFVAEIIESPALGKAGLELWRAYAGPLTALGRRSAAARGSLLDLFPTGPAYSAELDEAWLDLLEATGAIDALVSDGAPPEARPSSGRAAWFDKLLQHLSRAWRAVIPGRALDLLQRMAPMLIRDGAPIRCASRSGRIDLDIAELALELGVPIALPESADRGGLASALDLGEWAKRAGARGRGRDPVRVAAHPVLGPILASAVATSIGSEPFDGASRGKRGLLAAKRAWLEGVIARAEQGALPGVEDALAVVQHQVKADTFAELPDLHARFAALDLAPALARTLQVGLIDELGWPALEAAVDELIAAGQRELAFHGGPPAVVVVGRTRALAVSPTGRLGEHDLVIPPRHELVSIRFIGGEFLVLLKGDVYRLRAYWSRAPRDVFDTELTEYTLAPLVEHAAMLGDGAWIESTSPMRAGDRKLSFGTGLCASDGTTSWAREWKDGALRWREISPSGELGRWSWPPFIEAGLDGEWRVDAESYVFPAPGGVTSSPLGVANGLVGARLLVRERSGERSGERLGERRLEMIDGAAWSGPPGVPASCLVRLPGGGAPRPVHHESDRRSSSTMIYDSEGRVLGSRLAEEGRRYLRGQPVALAPGFWHAMVPRDEAGSRRLRAATDEDARALMAAVPAHPGDVTAGVLELADPRLRAGVTGVAVLAVELRLERDRLARERAPRDASARGTTAGHTDAELLEGLAGWTDGAWRNGRAWSQIERAAEVWSSADRSDRAIHEVPAAALDWLPFAVARWSLAFIATAIGTPARRRGAVVDLLAHLIARLPPVEQLRIYRAEGPLASGGYQPFELRWHGGNAYAVRRLNAVVWRVLEWAPGGTFVGLPGLTLTDELRGAASPSPSPSLDEVAALGTAVVSGKTSWAPDRAERLAAATGLTLSEAIFLAAGAPNASDSQANFLDKALREQLGLRAPQAAVARNNLVGLPMLRRLAVIDEAARAGIPALLDGRAIDALAAAWNRVFGRRIAIPEELIAAADRELAAPHKPSQALAMIASPETAPALAIDGLWGLDAEGDPIRVAAPAPLVGQDELDRAPLAFDVAALETVASYVPFLYAELPVGHALRARAAVAHAQLLHRLANPGLWLAAGSAYIYDNAAKSGAQQLLASLGGEELTGLPPQHIGRRIPGAAVVFGAHRLNLNLHPATLDAKAAALIAPLAAIARQGGRSTWQLLAYVRSADAAAIAARIRETPVPAGGFEQAPLASAPALVEEVARARGLSREAAALYLQFLVLLWPTPRNLMMWNGWKPKQLDAAIRELVARELILEARRERAQRSHFLPGGWETDRPPHPPRELWKVPLYAAPGGTSAPLGRYLALAPFHVLFERAWRRVESGDVPRYEGSRR